MRGHPSTLLCDSLTHSSAFMLTSCCFQLMFGRIYTFYTPKYVFLVLIVLFEIGSTVCAAAPNSTAFIIGRAIAGMGSAGITSGVIILMVAVVPLEKRPKASLGLQWYVTSALTNGIVSRHVWCCLRHCVRGRALTRRCLYHQRFVGQ